MENMLDIMVKIMMEFVAIAGVIIIGGVTVMMNEHPWMRKDYGIITGMFGCAALVIITALVAILT